MSWRSFRTWITHPTGMAGAFLGATVVAASPGGVGILGLVFGWAYGMVVGALIRAFRVPPAAYPLAGLLAGPLPFAVFMTKASAPDARPLAIVGLLLGLILGLVEWARACHERRRRELGADEA